MMPFLLAGLFSAGLFTGCRQQQRVDDFRDELDSIAVVWAPDIREAIFDAKLYSSGGKMVLKGETDIPEAKSSVIGMLHSNGIEFTDSLTLLPDTSVIDKPWGLVTVSTGNIRAAPAHSSEMVSQALLGTPVKILKKEGNWFLIQTPDRYLGWLDSDALSVLSNETLENWKASRRIIYMKSYGNVYGDREKSSIVSDIVSGSLLETTGKEKGIWEVLFPDGRRGFIAENEAIFFSEWLLSASPTPENLGKSAVSLMGIPYLWGGASPKGLDCSGFVKMVYFLNGIIVPRDADQQFREGTRLFRGAYPDSLQTGDLLFFGTGRRGRQRPTHVGIYLDDTRFIHASGMVRINSLDSARIDFSRGRRDTFMGIRRFSGEKVSMRLRKVAEHPWYN